MYISGEHTPSRAAQLLLPLLSQQSALTQHALWGGHPSMPAHLARNCTPPNHFPQVYDTSLADKTLAAAATLQADHLPHAAAQPSCSGALTAAATAAAGPPASVPPKEPAAATAKAANSSASRMLLIELVRSVLGQSAQPCSRQCTLHMCTTSC